MREGTQQKFFQHGSALGTNASPASRKDKYLEAGVGIELGDFSGRTEGTPVFMVALTTILPTSVACPIGSESAE